MMVEKRPDITPDAVATDEAALTEGCRAGDRRALDQFCRLYVRRVERVIGRLLGSTPDLDDLVQSTFIAAIGSFRRFRGEASLATWVTRIAVHVAQHQLRRGVRRQIPLELIPPEDELVAEARVTERILDDRRIAERLHAALDRVKPKKRMAFLLYALEGYTIEEVAALMGASRAATKSRIWFARREVLKLVQDDPLLSEMARPLVEEGA